MLFLFGLLQGTAVQSFANPRMALSAHLTAVQSGIALMIVGAIWSAVLLNAAFRTIARWAAIVGMYGLWLGLTLAAAGLVAVGDRSDPAQAGARQSRTFVTWAGFWMPAAPSLKAAKRRRPRTK